MSQAYRPPVQTDCCVDLSHSNGGLGLPLGPFRVAKASGVEMIIQKATQGTGFTDPTFAVRRVAADAAGLLFGAYHFCDGTDPQVQMKHFLQVIGDSQGIVLALDAEKNAASQVLPEQVCEMVYFLQKQTGHLPLLYLGRAGTDGLGTQMQDSGITNYLAQCDLWLPEYGNQPICPPGFARWVFHQYTGDGINGSGYVAGIGKGLDRSFFAGTPAELAEWHKRASGSGVAPTPVTTPVAPSSAPSGHS